MRSLVMVVMNKNNGPIKNTTNRFAEILKGKIKARNSMTNGVYALTDGLLLPAKSALVFELK